MSHLRTIPEAKFQAPPPAVTPVPGEAPGALAEASAAALVRALGTLHPEAVSHSVAVVDLAMRVARHMDLPPDRLHEVKLTALLHDVGKIGVPAEILEKPGPLADLEWELVLRHTQIGERLVRSMPGLWALGRPIRACHERWDGLGYPDGLSREEIPLASRIAFVCDAYDAMTSARAYREALPQSVALNEVVVNAGAQFCPRSAEALVDVVGGPFRLLAARRRDARLEPSSWGRPA